MLAWKAQGRPLFQARVLCAPVALGIAHGARLRSHAQSSELFPLSLCFPAAGPHLARPLAAWVGNAWNQRGLRAPGLLRAEASTAARSCRVQEGSLTEWLISFQIYIFRGGFFLTLFKISEEACFSKLGQILCF